MHEHVDILCDVKLSKVAKPVLKYEESLCTEECLLCMILYVLSYE